MAKLDRYILSQLTGPFAIFALILVGVYWVGRAIGLFDEMIGDGQSVGVFLEIMVLFLPQVVAIILPVVSFAAAIFVSNRLHSESEMVVFQSAGITQFRLMRPCIIFGFFVAILSSLLSHYLVPVSLLQLSERQREMTEDMAARMIVGGKFLHPSDNVTFFVREVQDDGALIDIFLYDQRPAGRDVTYTAHKAVLFRKDDEARLVMFDGLIQAFDSENQLLTKVQFDEFVFDIGTLAGAKGARGRKMQEFSTLSSLFPTPAMMAATGATAAAFKIEAHRRLEQPLQSFVYPLIGMAALMLGSFSRFGVFRQILLAVGVVVGLSVLSVPLRDIVRKDVDYWFLFYVPDIVGLLTALWFLRLSTHKGRKPAPDRHPAQGVAA